jgi:hypothetical protein
MSATPIPVESLMYTRSQTLESSLEVTAGVVVGGTSVLLAVGATRVRVAVGGTGVAVSVGKTSSVAAAGALHPIKTIPIKSTIYMVFILQPPYLAVS